MAVIETLARVGTGSAVRRLVCHPRLSLFACFNDERPEVHVWDFGRGQLSELGIVDAGPPDGTDGDGEREPWELCLMEVA
jgi:hypothetical protein